MKVLWFTNTPSLGAAYLNENTIGGGWIESLEREITETPNFELGIVFKWIQPGTLQYIIGKTKFYPITKNLPSKRIKKLINRWLHIVEYEEYIQQYLNVIETFKPDVIHIFGTESDFGLIISRIPIPCIIHIQGNLTVINHKWFSGFTAVDILKYSKKWLLLKGHGIFHNYFKGEKSAKREREIFHKCKYFMGRTDWDRRIASVLSPDSKYYHCDEIMRHGFYFHLWQQQTTGTSYTIISTVRGGIYKGLETIYECKKLLKQIFTDYSIVWKVAGINEEDEITYLIERKSKDKFIDNDILLLGPLQENELISEMLKADLFVHPSHIDNSPNSICEAMLLGMPVIATYAGGIPSIISDQKEGLLVQDGDPFALAGAIIELFKDKNYARNLGFNARERALIRHNPHRILNDVLNIYSSICQKSNTK